MKLTLFYPCHKKKNNNNPIKLFQKELNYRSEILHRDLNIEKKIRVLSLWQLSLQQLPWRQFERWAKGATIEIQCEFESIEMFGPKKRVEWKKFKCKKEFGKKNFLVKKLSGQKKFDQKLCMSTNFGSKNILGPRIFLVQKKIWIQKTLAYGLWYDIKKK